MLPEERPIRVPCRVKGCPCQSYQFVPLNGTQPIRCRCKHFPEQHSAAPGFPCNSCKSWACSIPCQETQQEQHVNGICVCPGYWGWAALVTDVYFHPWGRMRNGKEDITFCTGGFKTTCSVSLGPVKSLNLWMLQIGAYGDRCLKMDSTKAPCLQFVTSICMHLPFLPELGSLRKRSVDLPSFIALLTITLIYFYVFSQLSRK